MWFSSLSFLLQQDNDQWHRELLLQRFSLHLLSWKGHFVLPDELRGLVFVLFPSGNFLLYIFLLVVGIISCTERLLLHFSAICKKKIMCAIRSR
jgi:hypothetical protein